MPKMALLELIAEVLNFGALVHDRQLQVGTFALELLYQFVALLDLFLLLAHDLHHKVLFLAVLSTIISLR